MCAPFAMAGFIDPNRLYWLLVIPAFGVVLWFLRKRKPMTKLIVRAIVVLLLLTAIARPKHVEEVKHLGTAFLLDVSKSVPLAKRELALERLERWFEKIPPGDQASLILFGDRPSVEVPFGRPRSKESDAGFGARLDRLESRVIPTETDLARAVEFAEGLFPDGVAKRIVLFSDGNQTRGDLEGAARALKAGRVRLDVFPLTYAFTDEVIVEGLHGPGRGRIGEPVALRATISAQSSTDAQVTLSVNGKPLGPPETVRLKEGMNVLRFSPRPTDRGYLQYDVTVRAEKDGNRANNVGRAGVVIGGEPRVLIVVNPEDDDERLKSVLVDAGLKVDVITSKDLPSHPGGYLDVDAVVLENVPAYAFDDARHAALRDAVKELGIGLLVVGGNRSFGPGGYRGTPLADLLPVDLDTTNKKSFPKGALAIVLHSIEFDSGNTWAVRICKSAMQSMNDDDLAGVVLYGMSGERWLFPLTPMRARERMYQQIDACSPGDMISLHASFSLIETGFAETDAAVKHVVVVSDGDPTMPSPELVQRLVDAQTTISCICIEPHGPLGSRPMQNLATAGGGRFYELKPSLGELEELPHLMLKEAATLRRSSIVEKPFLPIVLLPNSPMLRGFGAGAPNLLGYVVTSMKSGAQTILLANEEEKDPLLATWYAGLGRVTAFTSDASSRWSKEWLAWSGFAPFWTELVRAVIPTAPETTGNAEVKTEGDVLCLAWDVRDTDDTPVTAANVHAVVIGGAQDPVRVEMIQDEPGRYVARTAALPAGHYLVRFEAVAGEKRYDTLEVAAIDYSPEDRAMRSNEGLLTHAAMLSGGKVIGAADDPFARDFETVSAETEMRAWFIVLALCLLVFEIAQRRFDLRILERLRAAMRERRERAARRPVAVAAASGSTVAAPSAPTTSDPGYRPKEVVEKSPVVTKNDAAPAAPNEAEHLDLLKKARDKAQKKREWR